MRTSVCALALSTLALCACNRSPAAAIDAGQPAPSVASAPPPVPVPLLEAGALRHLLLPCRAIAVQGTPTVQGDGGTRTLVASDFAADWITLAAGDSLTAKLPRSGRELTFLGPGLVEPCVLPDEAWVTRGRFQGSRGSGEAPGAEEWVVTPSAVVRYGAAILEVAVDGSVVTVSLKGGSATILAEGSTTWDPVPVGAPRVVKGAPLAKGWNAAAASRCTKASDEAKALEDALQAPGATTSPSFGEAAMRATEARQLARATCAISKLREAP